MAKMTEQDLLRFLEAEQADALAVLRATFKYEDGKLIRLRTTNYNAKAGDVAGCLHKATGYLCVNVEGKVKTVHRIVWALHHGVEPEGQIDHINGNKTDNRIENLRCVDHRVNAQNIRRARSHNALGMLGVHKCRGKYQARIVIDGRRAHLGSFATPEAAHAAYVTAKREMHEGCTI